MRRGRALVRGLRGRRGVVREDVVDAHAVQKEAALGDNEDLRGVKAPGI